VIVTTDTNKEAHAKSASIRSVIKKQGFPVEIASRGCEVLARWNKSESSAE